MDTNFLSYVATFNDTKYNIIKPPTYLSYYLPNTNDILLLHKKFQDQNVSIINLCSERNSDQENGSIIDLTGCPLNVDLEDSTALEKTKSGTTVRNLWLAEEEFHQPMSVEDARKMLNYYNLSERCLNVYGLFCVCDGQDPDNTVILGSSCQTGIFARHILKTQGHHRRIEEAMQISKLLRNHEVLAQRLVKAETTTRVESVYNIYGVCYPVDTDQTNLQYVEKNGYVALEVSWKKPSYLVPTSHSKTELIIQTVVGHTISELVLLSTELDRIQTLIDLVEKYKGETEGKMNCDIPMPFRPDSKDEEQILSEINALFQAGDNITQLRRMAQFKAVDIHDLKTSVANIVGRGNRDFTDLLWEILSDCCSFSLLTDCLHYVLSEVASGNVRPFVHSNNNTSIAALIRDVEKGCAFRHNLTGCEPLEYLIEMGIEKLNYDIKTIFSECSIPMDHFTNTDCLKEEGRKNKFGVTLEDRLSLRQSTVPKVRKSIYHQNRNTFGSRLKMNLNSDDRIGVADYKLQMTVLGRALTVLEILLMAKTYINHISNDTFLGLAKAALNRFMVEDSVVESYPDLQAKPLQTIRLEIPHCPLVESINQDFWKLTVITENATTGINTTFHQSRQFILPPIISSDEDIPNIQATADSYYCTEYLYLWNKFNN